MGTKLNLKLLLLLFAAVMMGCKGDPTTDPALEEELETETPNVIGEPLVLNVYDANILTRATESDATTHFEAGDKIGLFIVIGDYIQEFNECYTMNSTGSSGMFSSPITVVLTPAIKSRTLNARCTLRRAR